MKATKRKNVGHVVKMSNRRFSQFIKNLDKTGGILTDFNATLKVDGLGARFGKDTNGNVFFESSRSGPIFNSGDFYKYTRDKSDSLDSLMRAAIYDVLVDYFKKSDIMLAIPPGAKVVCELLYNTLGYRYEPNHIQFVTIPYDRAFLGERMTIVPIGVVDVNTGEEHEYSQRILECLFSWGDEDVKIVDPRLNISTLDLKPQLLSCGAFDMMVEHASRRNTKTPEVDKMISNMVTRSCKENVSDAILDLLRHRAQQVLGPVFEGVVLNLPIGVNGESIPFKVVTSEFTELFNEIKTVDYEKT